MSGRSARVKGNAFERWLVHFFTDMGWYAKRVPMSGAADGFKDDVHFARTRDDWEQGHKWHAECKRWKAGMKTIYRYLPKGGVLVYKSDHEEELFIMTASTFKEFVDETVDF